MNKLFTKIVGAALGLTMAIGVGVAVASGKEVVPVHATNDSTFTVEFVTTDSGDGTALTTQIDEADYISSGASYVELSSVGSKQYYGGASGLKLGTSSAGGSVTFDLFQEIIISKITLHCASYSSNSSKYATFTVKAGSTSATTYTPSSTTLSDHDFTFSSITTDKITISTNKYGWVDALTVTYTLPKSVSLALKSGSSSTILYGDTTTLVATTSGGASGTYVWSLQTNTPSSGSANVVTFTDANASEMTFTGNYSGTAVVRITIDGVHADFTITVNRKLNELVIKTAPTNTAYDEGDDFDDTGLVVTANFLGGASEDIAATSGKLTYSPSTSLSSSTTQISISYTENGITKSAFQAVTVNAPAYTLESISWSATDLNVYSGTTLTSEIVDAFAVEAVWEESVPNTPLSLGTYTLRIGSDEITSSDLPLTWTTAHSGKKLTASYTNNAITKTVSVDVIVVETLNKISHNEEGTSTKVSFVPGTDTGTTSVTKGDLTATMTTMNNDEYYQIYANASGTFAVASGKGLITKIEFTCTASGTSKYGPGNGSANVGTYSYSGNTGTWTGSAESVSISTTAQIRMSSLDITYTPISEVTYSNKNFAAQKAALEFVNDFNETMACNLNGGTSKSTVLSRWETVVGLFSTRRTESGQAAAYNNLFKYASAANVVDDGEGHGITPEGDSLQKMLAKYNYIVSTFEAEDFLNTDANVGRTAVQASAYIAPFGYTSESNNTALIIVIISLVGLTAVGGYFLIRRRKEQ